MFLKRLELQGFKSFADKTVLNFGNGVTSVVGPNGSGKSNISDAIRWVMGEMSAKSLRGSNMQDVIFAGTEKRKHLNFAEVSLVLDNSDHVFPVEFDEVIVTRRVFRSGETAYQINRANCRLKDIHELFMDTGLGRDGYSIIGQGNVAQILSTKAEDRRSLFEEAAGVSKYKYRKEEALRKLNSTEENLIRISDISAELESQLTPLKNQSEKARKYLVLYEEFKALDVNLGMILFDRNACQQAEADKLYESVSEELNALREKESEAESRISSLYDQSKAKDEEHREKNQQLSETRSKKMEYANQITLSENNIKNNTALARRVDQEIAEIRTKNEQRKLQIRELFDEAAKKEEEIRTQTQTLDALKRDDSTQEEKLIELEQQIAKKRSDISDARDTIASKRERTAGIDKLRETHLRRREDLESEQTVFEQGLQSIRDNMEQDRRAVQDKTEKNEKLKKLIHQTQEKVEQLNREQHKVSEEENRLKVEFESKSAKCRMLKDMENDYEGYAKSVKAVLKAPQLSGLAIFGTVAGLIETEQQYAVAIEMALGGAMQNIVVESEQDAKEAIRYLRETRAGRATFLPISSVNGRGLENLSAVLKEPGVIGCAADLIRYQKAYDGIMKNLLGRVVVVDTMDHGIALSRKFGYKFRTVTLEGDLLNAGGSMSGGSITKTGGFLSRAAEIKQLKHEMMELERQLKALADQHQKTVEQLNAAQTQLSTYLPLSREYENEILRLTNTMEHLEESLAQSGHTRENYDRQMQELTELLSQTADETAQLLIEIRAEEARIRELSACETELLENLSTAREEQKERSEEIMDKTLLLSQLQRDLEDQKSRSETLNREIADGESEAEKKREDAGQMLQNNTQLAQAIEEKKRLVQELGVLEEAIIKEISGIDRQKEQIVENLREIQSSNKDLTDTLLKLQQELSRAETRRVKLNMEKENLINRFWEDYELTLTAAEELRSPVENEKEAGKRLAELKGQIKSLGSVNMDAIEEYKNVSERFAFLSEQKADLEKSKDNLNKIITSMEELMQSHFGEQFSIINESFGQVFTELFGGGRGRLYLQDPDNVLESGIEIEVQLPGKGLQNINLYSGGEKSFIAIALLFAILRVKPTPFCILDEIDAALDDVNVSRFATYLKNYLDQSQFIVITHRRGTMEAANIMYGVTMQEKGVSKLLSLQIDEVDDDLVS